MKTSSLGGAQIKVLMKQQRLRMYFHGRPSDDIEDLNLYYETAKTEVDAVLG